MTGPIDIGAIAAGTGRSFEDWLEFLRSIGAQALTHAEIAERVEATGDASSWWAQTVTVAFEQHIGRRVPGQTSRGDYRISVSRTLVGDVDAALARWLEMVEGRTSFDEVPLTSGPEIWRTPKWRYWRAGLADGSRLQVSIHRKSNCRAGFAMTHEKLDSPENAATWRAFWNGFLANLRA